MEVNQIISENQMGTKKRCQGAKEQVLTNIGINKNTQEPLLACWIDIMKAYDTVEHGYLMKTLKMLGTPETILKFVERLLENQNINLNRNNENIGEIRPERGILQGDSLSPILFVICIEPLSRILNGFDKIYIQNKDGSQFKLTT
ncbi:hypothetical protein ENBRE01_3457 [Enteropsectra breve]|nr:hypothetical protein ENBRE01_3457 [Enteropsectra breve]